MPELKPHYFKNENNEYASPITSALTVMLDEKGVSVEEFANSLDLSGDPLLAERVDTLETDLSGLQSESTATWELLNIVDNRSRETETNSSDHIANKNNPHEVDATQVLMTNVDGYTAPIQEYIEDISDSFPMLQDDISAAIDAATGAQKNLTTHTSDRNNPHEVIAKQVLFDDGQSFQGKLDAGELTGATGADGKSAFVSAQSGGYTGSETQFYSDLAAIQNLASTIISITGGA